jgi:hypothetical protein
LAAVDLLAVLYLIQGRMLLALTIGNNHAWIT